MILEVSSHALYQSRIRPITFTAVGFTNLSHEHLDFHWTMEHYAKTKSQLFAEVLPESIGIVAKDFSYRDLLNSISKVHSMKIFGYSDDCDIFVSDIQQNPFLSFKLHFKSSVYDINTKIL